MRAAFHLALAASVLGCSSEHTLQVFLQTDLRYGEEFDAFELEWARGATIEDELSFPGLLGDYLDGVRIAEIDTDSGAGQLTLRVFNASEEIASRRVLVSVNGVTGATIVITRDCVGVSCPEAGSSPLATECLGGRCVTPECRPEDPASCDAPECACPDVPACVSQQCVAGACLRLPNDDRCSAGYCDVDEGCVEMSDTGPPDAGHDAGLPDSAEPDAPVDTGPPDVGVDSGPPDTGSMCMPFAGMTGCTDCCVECTGDCQVTCSGDCVVNCPSGRQCTLTCEPGANTCQLNGPSCNLAANGGTLTTVLLLTTSCHCCQEIF